MKIQLQKRDIKLLEFVFRFKAVTFKQLEKHFFNRDSSTVSKRLTKLRKCGLISVTGKAPHLNSSMIFGLTKQGFKQLMILNPHAFLVERFKSNSPFHDVTLVEIEKLISSKMNVEFYWPENIIQSSRFFAEDDSLSYFREFGFDGLIKYKTETNGSFIFGLEYENSQKGLECYKSKLKKIYSQSRPQAVLYICKTKQIENALKKAESEIATNQNKRLYFIQYDELIKGEKTLTFENQDSKKIVIK